MAIKPKLLTDSGSHPIQAIELADDATAILVGLTSSADVIPANAMALRIGLDTAAYIRFGTASVTVSVSNGHYFPAGVEVLVVPKGATHLANISADGSTTGNGTMGSLSGTHQRN